MNKLHIFGCLSFAVFVGIFWFRVMTTYETIGSQSSSEKYQRVSPVVDGHRESSTPPCGKICSYDWDSRENGTFWPLLRKPVNCSNIMQRIAHSPYPVILPPPRRPPASLLNDFTLNGHCPITGYSYCDNSKPRKSTMNFTAERFRRLLEQDRVKNINSYRDRNVVKPLLKKYVSAIDGKNAAVVGTERPWAEAMLLNLGARHVTTIEYRKLMIADSRVTTVTPYQMAERFSSGRAEWFDVVFTYSSLEHSGLGRYGDPLTPFGDLEATAQLWCMVRPGGLLILAVPESGNRRSCSVMWNGGRFYGTERLQHLTANWRVLDAQNAGDYWRLGHGVYVLQKILS